MRLRSLLIGAAIGVVSFATTVLVWMQNPVAGQTVLIGVSLIGAMGFIVALEWPKVNVLRLVFGSVLAVLIVLADMPWWAVLICIVVVMLAGDFSPSWLRRPTDRR